MRLLNCIIYSVIRDYEYSRIDAFFGACPVEMKGFGRPYFNGISTLNVLSSVDYHNNPSISTARHELLLES